MEPIKARRVDPLPAETGLLDRKEAGFDYCEVMWLNKKQAKELFPQLEWPDDPDD